MAKYTIHHCCGHAREIALFGKIADRERTIERLEKGECPECARAREARAADAALSKSAFSAIGEVELSGSEKQIAWAKTIRANVVSGFDALALRDDAKAKVVAFFSGKTESRWWIDARGFSPRALLEMNAKEIMK